MREGLLLPAESAVGGLSAAASASAEKIVKEHRKREAKMARDESRASGAVVPAKSSFRGLFVGQGISPVAVASWDIGIVGGVIAADVIVTPDPLARELGSLELWHAVLSGCLLVDPKWTHGVRYKPAVQTQRRVWVSKGFREKHANLFSVMKAFVDCSFATKCGKWKILDSTAKADFKALAHRVKNRPDVIGLLTTAEREAGDPKHTYNGPGFFKFIAHLDLPLCRRVF